MKKLDELLAQIGLNKSNGLFFLNEKIEKDNWKNNTAFPNRVKRLIEKKIKPDAFFSFDNKPMVLFFENREDKDKLHKAIWNFNECPIAIFIDNKTVEIFNGFNYLKDKAILDKIGGYEKLNDFSYLKLVTGKTWEQYQDELDYKNRVDYHLLENIKSARKLLVEKHHLDAKIVNSIIGKSIFVRYLIDRGVKMKYDGTLRKWTNDEFCRLFDSPRKVQDFFNYLEDSEKGFNGDLFPLSASEYRDIDKEDYQVIKRLLQGDDIEKNQPSLFQFYDFSIIPIEFISNIYELFIGQDNQKQEGAYYTPLFLVDYILKETVEKKISKRKSNFNCKVLDPACGSGVFLVETLRKVIEKYILETGIDAKEEREKFKTAIKKLAKENIYGIDKDLSAVQVAVFSIYLTLLDYLDPPGIETFKFPILLNSNLFEADFFDKSAHFNITLNQIEFDFILGNPPWKRGKGEKEKPSYIEYVEAKRKEEINSDEIKAEIGNKEIAQAFLIRCSDFSTQQTNCALIVTSKTLYNLQSQNFRKYFLKNFFIERVFELAPVRREVFDKSNDKAIAPACVLFYKYANGKNTESNSIEHIALKPSRFFSLFKIFTINKVDFKKVQQNRLSEYDWLWKVLVYGSFLDFNLIKRLKEDYQTIEQIIGLQNDLLTGQGLMVGGGDENDASELLDNIYIDTRYDIKPYWINPNNKKKWTIKTVHRIRNKELYKAPVLLIAGGLNNDLKSVSAISYEDCIYRSSLTGIKGKGKNTIKKLRQFSGVLNSSFFSYLSLMTFSSAGIEREEAHDEEKLNIPFKESSDIASLVEEIETLQLKLYSKESFFNNDEIFKSIKIQRDKIDIAIINSLSFSILESSLLDYAKNISVPLITKQKDGLKNIFNSLKFREPVLEDYAEMFLKRFKSKLDTERKKFIVEIWYSDQIVGMLFKMISIAEYSSSIIWENKQDKDNEIISLLTKISSEKITDKLFVQKDIRGFEKEDFYIFKPNERRLWHEAVAYLDVNEFADAILKKGKAK